MSNTVWKGVAYIFERKIHSSKVNFRQGDEEYLLKLEKTLCDVNMTTMDFELVLTMKMMSNEEFHLDTTKDVGQEINDFEAI